MADYGSREYWTDRYKREVEDYFEWYQTYAGIKQVLGPYLNGTRHGLRVLDLGCGNSSECCGRCCAWLLAG